VPEAATNRVPDAAANRVPVPEAAATHVPDEAAANRVTGVVPTAEPSETAVITEPPEAAVTHGRILAGDSIEVWWEDQEKFFPCVVKGQAADTNDTTASECLYDGETKTHWHNLECERYRFILPTGVRLHKLTVTAIKGRLSSEKIKFEASARKEELLELLLHFLTNRFRKTKQASQQPRAKYGYSHKDRMTRKKRKREDMQAVSDEKSLDGEGQAKVPCVDKFFVNRTISQVVADIGAHGMALHTLSTRGSRRDDRQSEREGYNLLIFSQSKMDTWQANSHKWKPGDKDMSLLPPQLTSLYDTKGWECVNCFADDDRVVFKRPDPPIPARGSGAKRRLVRTNAQMQYTPFCSLLNNVSYTQVSFKWTPRMLKWFHGHTRGYTFKSISFVNLVQKAESLWGYKAPQQEHMENKIKSRDKAQQEGRTVRWVLEIDNI